MGLFGRWAAGEPLEWIASDYGVTRERVRCWLTKVAVSDSWLERVPHWRFSRWRWPEDEE